MNTELEKKLYRKKMLEAIMMRMGKGADVMANLAAKMKERIQEFEEGSYERVKLESELIEQEFIARSFITNFKESKREYNDDIRPAIEAIVTAEKIDPKGIEFADWEKGAEDLANYEIYGKATKQPENVEHVEMIALFQKKVDIQENIIKLIPERMKKEKDPLAKARMESELFSAQLQIENTKKRLYSRQEYYNDQFLPRYKADMERAKTHLPKLLLIANEMVRTGVDIKLKVLLDQREKHKDDKEHEWLFYVSLNSRLKKIAKEMRADQTGEFKDHMRLAKKENFA